MTSGGALRPLRREDAVAVLAAFASDPEMSRQGTVRDEAEARAYVARLTEPGGRHRPWAVVDEADRVAGLVAVSVDDENRSGWFWYWMHAAHRGRGWTAAAATAVANWALADGGLDRLEMGHRANNPASGRIAAAAGFVREGRERGKFLVDGRRIDVLAYGRLRSDLWPATPQALGLTGNPWAAGH